MRKSLSLAVAALLLCGVVRAPGGAAAQAPQPRAADAYAERLRAFEDFVAAVYFRRAFESNPDGVMRVKTFLDIGGRWLNRPQLTDAGVEYIGAAGALYPKDAAAREMLGDFLARKGRLEEAAESYRQACALDPAVGKGASADDYVAGRLKASGQKKN